MLAKGFAAMLLSVFVANVAFVKGALLGAALTVGGCMCCTRNRGMRRC